MITYKRLGRLAVPVLILVISYIIEALYYLIIREEVGWEALHPRMPCVLSLIRMVVIPTAPPTAQEKVSGFFFSMMVASLPMEKPHTQLRMLVELWYRAQLTIPHGFLGSRGLSDRISVFVSFLKAEDTILPFVERRIQRSGNA